MEDDEIPFVPKLILHAANVFSAGSVWWGSAIEPSEAPLWGVVFATAWACVASVMWLHFLTVEQGLE